MPGQRIPRGSPRSGASEVYGRVVLVSGPEALLAERAVARLVAAARKADAEVEVATVEAGRLDGQMLAELTGPSLFSSRRAAVITDLPSLPVELAPAVVALAEDPPGDLLLVLVHPGGVKGKGLLDRLRALKVETVDCPTTKAWELPQFVTAECRRAGGNIDAEGATALVDAVGHDLRSLAAAVSQLVADTETGQVTADQIRRYFGGRAEVTSFAVADAVLAGRTGVAMEQLRWAMSTGVSPVLITSAMAAGLRGLGKLITTPGALRDAELAGQIGVPTWKLKSMRSQARGWDQAGLAHALRAVAAADADVKGAAEDADFALEKMLIAVSRARRG